jgi:hypothetical protein
MGRRTILVVVHLERGDGFVVGDQLRVRAR